MNSALPTPQPARNPMIALMLGEAPASALKITIRISPAISVFLAPIRLETQLVISIATSLGEACSWWEMAGRIGSTRPMPMNDTTQANATAKTAFGCWNGLATEPACGALINCSLSRRADWVVRIEPCRFDLGAGQRVDGRQSRGQRRLVLRADPGRNGGQSLDAHGPAAGRLGDEHLF